VRERRRSGRITRMWMRLSVPDGSTRAAGVSAVSDL
jgi:hypothetical protein